MVAKAHGSFLFVVTSADGACCRWTINLKSGTGSVLAHPFDGAALPTAHDGDVTIKVTDDDFADIVSVRLRVCPPVHLSVRPCICARLGMQGKLNPHFAFMTGRVGVSGNMMLATKLGDVLKTESNEVQQLRATSVSHTVANVCHMHPHSCTHMCAHRRSCYSMCTHARTPSCTHSLTHSLTHSHMHALLHMRTRARTHMQTLTHTNAARQPCISMPGNIGMCAGMQACLCGCA